MKPQKLLIIGAGAFEGAWDPVLELYGVSDPTEAIRYMSLAVHAARFDHATREKLPGRPLDRLQFLRDQKEALAQALSDSHFCLKQPLGHQKSGDDFLKEYDAIINLNWDSSLSHYLKSEIPVVYLHGSVKVPQSLVFPTEHVFLQDHFDESAKRLLVIEFRRAMEWLKISDHVTLWGCALNIYDSELMSVLFATKSKERKIKVINPDSRLIEFVKTVHGDLID